MSNYVELLETEMIKRNFSESYIEICTQYAKRLHENKLPIIFDSTHLALLLGIEKRTLLTLIFASEYHYREIKIPKKSGEIRTIYEPSRELKSIQKWILLNILNNIKISNEATGFVLKKSILNNAEQHIEKRCVINMDIKDFFPSIKFERVFRIFNYFGYTKNISFMLAKLCTFKGAVPQGAPTSPYISNIVCIKLDKRIKKLLEKYNGVYTRYADDITFSGEENICDCIRFVKEIIKDENFKVNEKKTRIAFKSNRQNITGLNVNSGRVTIPKKYRKEVKKEIYYCKKFGVVEHLKKTKCDKAFYKEHLYGKVFFIKMINKEEGEKLLGELDSISWDY